MIKEISTANAPAAIGPYSQALRAGNILCVSGQLPIDPVSGAMPNDIKAQANQSLRNLKAIIEASGANMSDVLKTTVYLSSINDFGAANEVYESFFSAPFPARAAFEVAALPKNAKIEIEAIVYVKD